MLIGIHQRPGDLKVNVCKKKALTNMRASGSDDTIKITPAIELSLDSMVSVTCTCSFSIIIKL